MKTSHVSHDRLVRKQTSLWVVFFLSLSSAGEPFCAGQLADRRPDEPEKERERDREKGPVHSQAKERFSQIQIDEGNIIKLTLDKCGWIEVQQNHFRCSIIMPRKQRILYRLYLNINLSRVFRIADFKKCHFWRDIYIINAYLKTHFKLVEFPLWLPREV